MKKGSVEVRVVERVKVEAVHGSGQSFDLVGERCNDYLVSLETGLISYIGEAPMPSISFPGELVMAEELVEILDKLDSTDTMPSTVYTRPYLVLDGELLSSAYNERFFNVESKLWHDPDNVVSTDIRKCVEKQLIDVLGASSIPNY